MSEYETKLDQFMFSEIIAKKNLNILEFGVREGISTKKFIDFSKKNGGHVYSVDIDDYVHLSNSSDWTFFKCRDDNFDFLDKKIPNEIDLIYLDSFHDADHVEKIIFHYFEKLKVNGLLFIDDISWVPYVSDNYRNSFNCEINNFETFNRIIEILRANKDNLNLSFSFVGSGMAKIIKLKNEKLNHPKKLKSRVFTLKNFFRKIVKNK